MSPSLPEFLNLFSSFLEDSFSGNSLVTFSAHTLRKRDVWLNLTTCCLLPFFPATRAFLETMDTMLERIQWSSLASYPQTYALYTRLLWIGSDLQFEPVREMESKSNLHTGLQTTN